MKKYIICDILNWYLYDQTPKNYSEQQLLELYDYSINHRIEGLAIDFILKSQKINVALKQQLNNSKNNIIKQQKTYEKLAIELNSTFEEKNVEFAFLKGIAVSQVLYAEDYHRAYNDIDLLTRTEHIPIIQDIVEEMGFQQGDNVNNQIVLASRQQILFQKLYTHEIYNYIRINDGIENNIDINFKFSWNGVNNIYEQMAEIPLEDVLSYRKVNKKSGLIILNNEYQWIHLCCHLYNELTFFALELSFEPRDEFDIAQEIHLNWLLDIILMIEKEEINFDIVYSICEKYKCIYKIEYALTLISSIFELPKKIKKLFQIDYQKLKFYYNIREERIERNVSLVDAIFD